MAKPLRQKKMPIPKCVAKTWLERDYGIRFDSDFHALSSSAVNSIAEVARDAGYRKAKNAPGSTARMYFQHLARTDCSDKTPRAVPSIAFHGARRRKRK